MWWSIPGLAGGLLWAGAVLEAAHPPSARIAYVTADEALIVADGTATIEAGAGSGVSLEIRPEETSRVRHWEVTGLRPGETRTLRLLAGDQTTETELRWTSPTAVPTSFRIKLTGALPLQPDPADLDLAAAGLQAQDAIATVAVGGLFTFADTDPAPVSARAYPRAADRRLSAAAWQGVWRRGAHYGVLGALDYGPAGANRHWRNRTAVHTAFKRYWPAPNRPLPDSPAAYEFTVGDVACFVLDAFSLADGVERPTTERTILGEAQRNWLANALAASREPFKVIFCGRPLLVPSADGFALHSFDRATRDFLKILDGPGAEGVVLVTGGGPVGQLTRFIRSSGYPLNELSLGPLARSFEPRPAYQRLNYFRVPGTLVRAPHFALFEVAGEGDERRLRLSMQELDGTELWAETLLASELQN